MLRRLKFDDGQAFIVEHKYGEVWQVISVEPEELSKGMGAYLRRKPGVWLALSKKPIRDKTGRITMADSIISLKPAIDEPVERLIPNQLLTDA